MGESQTAGTCLSLCIVWLDKYIMYWGTLGILISISSFDHWPHEPETKRGL
ncbi:hypothetical protein PDE_05869 [Penicillium oxalicum 114-2]|uniref:Uncharacterized protein n=1 Tax=Penicillium oxalicum (strain 114-2 / CGMCC 5302) TaxID=933388 RepID=S7ZQK0_PENO1|nr:hypothetical protein PDE_05869 [Penicillium oxalicum 114-2]